MSAFQDIEDALIEQDSSIYRLTPPVVGVNGVRSSNYQRTKDADTDLTLSYLFRPVAADRKHTDHYRNIDGDMRSVCNRCKSSIAFTEASTQTTDSYGKPKSMIMTSKLSFDTKHTSWAIKVIHHYKDYDTVQPLKELKIVENGTQVVFHELQVPVCTFHVLMENLVIWHLQNECDNQVPREMVWN